MSKLEELQNRFEELISKNEVIDPSNPFLHQDAIIEALEANTNASNVKPFPSNRKKSEIC